MTLIGMDWIKRIAVPIVLAVLVLIPFWDLLWLPTDQVVAGNDLDFMFLRWWRFGLESLRQGELPLWNPYLFSGVPFLANPQPAHFYPPVWLLWILPVTRVVGLLIVFHLWLGGIGMYGWLRSEGANRMGALFGAVVYAFGGYYAVRIFGGHLGVVMTQAWLPAILWAYHEALKRNRLAAAVLAGTLVALSFLAGHTASFLYVALVLAAYTLYYAWKMWQQTKSPHASLRPLLLAAVMVLVGLGLAAVQLLPTWEFVQLSTRQETSYAFAANQSWPPGYLLTLLVPNFFGELARAGYWGDGIYTELIFYVGVLPLVLALALGLGFRRVSRQPLVLFLLLVAGTGLLLALGQFGILHRLAYNFLPLFKSTRVPARAGFLFSFAMAALAGLALTWLLEQPEEAGQSLRGWIQGPLPWLVSALASLIILTGFMLFALQRETNPDVGRLWHLANSSALFLIFFLLTIGLLRAWRKGQLKSHQVAILAIGLVLLDLWGFARTLIQPAPIEESAYWRIASEITADSEGRVLPWGLSIFEHNKGMAFGLHSVFGYDPLELERYTRFTTAVPDPRARAYDLLHVRYLVTSHAMEYAEDPSAPQLVDQREGVWVYERPTALPSAWLVHQVEVHDEEAVLDRLNDPAFNPRNAVLLEDSAPCELAAPTQPDEVQFFRRGNNRVEVDVSADAPGVLVLSELFYPGWRATLDGEPVHVLQADYVLQALCVPAGQHRVVLTFSPSSLWSGAGITLVSLLLLGLAGLALWRGRSS